MELKPVILSIIISFVFYFIIHKAVKNKKPFKRAFLSVCSGPCALVAVNFIGGFFGVGIPVSILTVIISISLGIPGIISILLMNLFF